MKQSSNGFVAFSPEERGVLIARFRSSGLTQREFARREALKLSRFRNWLYGRAAVLPRQTKSLTLQEIPIGPLLASPPWAAEIALSGGTIIRLKADVDPVWVSAILEPWRGSCSA